MCKTLGLPHNLVNIVLIALLIILQGVKEIKHCLQRIGNDIPGVFVWMS